jgi:hypothetical protein
MLFILATVFCYQSYTEITTRHSEITYTQTYMDVALLAATSPTPTKISKKFQFLNYKLAEPTP